MNKQGKFIVFHDTVMNSQVPVSPSSIHTFAKDAGLNLQLFNQGLQSYKSIVNQMIAKNMKVIKAMQINGTPSFVVAKTNATSSSQFEFYPGLMSQTALQKMISTIRKS